MIKYGKIISGAAAAVMALGGTGAFNATADDAGITDGAVRYVQSQNIDLPGIPEDEVIASGSCGDDLTWRLRKSGTLTVSGTGEMEDYRSTWNDRVEAPWFSYKDKIKIVIIGQGVTYIGEYAFRDCTAIETVTVNDTVKGLGEGCFYGCTALKEVPVMNGVKLINRYAFSKCTALKSLTVPDSVNEIGTNAFSECTGLTSAKFGNVETVGAGAFTGCTALSYVEISSGVKKIGNSAFFGCTSLKSVMIPAEVTSVSAFAFGYVPNSGGTGGGKALEGFTIYGFRDSTADSYAASNSFIFKALDDMGSGDLDRSGAVDIKDLILMQKIVAGWKVDYDEAAANVDGVGGVSVNDLVYLQKYVSGWKVQLGVKSER